MTTVCVTYNTLSLTLLSLLREYETGLSASKSRIFDYLSSTLFGLENIVSRILQSRCQCRLANVSCQISLRRMVVFLREESGEFEGWQGESTYTLFNGQVSQQAVYKYLQVCL